MVTEIFNIVEAQRAFFRTGITLDVKWRLKQLRLLRDAVIAHEQEFELALQKDLGKSPTEAYLCDIGPVIVEINEMLRSLRRWARPERHFSGLMCFPSLVTTVYKMPYGVTLVISPFNFPILLTLGVVAASICGGNTVVIKASSKSHNSTQALKQFIAQTFPPQFVTLIDGSHEVADLCLQQRWDKIFYTGSPKVGKHVMEKASANLTPVALELGGESGNWCIVRKDANIKDAARKIAFLKLCNAGQICININQIAVAQEIASEFIDALKSAFESQIGKDACRNEEYPKLITQQAYERCAAIATEYRSRIVFGGSGDSSSLRFAPTIIYPVEIDEEIVQQELFCPLLPIVPFKESDSGNIHSDSLNLEQLLNIIESREHPLALYLFTKNIKWAKQIMHSHQYGGGCINEVCVHMMVKGVPFGGVGHSGMGAYHGEWGFREFTHPSTVLKGYSRFNLSIREHPYKERKILPLLRRLEK